MPREWSKMITKMLYKKGEKENPEKDRPMSLVCTIVKLVTVVLFNRVYTRAKKRKQIPEQQAEFCKKEGTLDHLFVLNSLIEIRLRNKGGKLFALFVDLKQALPSVSHPLLWRKIKAVGVSNKIINILSDMYSKAKLAVVSSEGS